MVATFDDIEARDEESGLLHLAHAATNIAFILQLMEGTKYHNLNREKAVGGRGK